MIIERYDPPFTVWTCVPDDASPDEIQYAKGEWPPDRIWGPIGRPQMTHYLSSVSSGVFELLEKRP